MRKLHGLGILTALAALVLAACQQPDAATSRPGPAPADSAARLPSDVTPPPGLAPDAVTPLEGDALERAQLPLDQIVATLAEPGYLQAPATQPAAPEDEPPLAAQRAYAAGRRAWKAGESYQAIPQLEQALRLAPGRPAILRLLGRIYTGVGNKVRGAHYLEQAVAQDPADTQSVFLLGRFALEQGRNDEAIAAFHRVLNPPAAPQGDTDPALRQLSRYFLAAALAEAGYGSAAIEQFRAYLADPETPRQLSRAARELIFLDRQQGFTWQAVGDLHHQLSQPAAALDAYKRARRHGVPDADALMARLLYTHLRLGHTEQAQRLAIDQIQQGDGAGAHLDLVAYLTEQGVGAAALADRLEALYVEQDRPAALALAIARLLPPERGEAVLRRHLDAKPEDHDVFAQLLDQWLLPEGAADAEAAQVAEAIRVTAQVVTAAPDAAADHTTTLIRVADSPKALLRGFDALPADEQAQPVVQVLRGLTLAAAGRLDDATATLERAMQADSTLTVARLQLARIAVLRGQFDRAAQLLEPLAQNDDDDVVALRVRVLAETGQVDEALRLLDQLVDAGTAATPLILQKARLQLEANDAAGAERTLLDALNTRPDDEAIYAALFQLYEPAGGASPIADSQRQWSRLVRRLLGTIPNSRLGRLVRAQLHDAKGEFADAEVLLKGLLAQDERDLEALLQLLEVYVRADRRDEAVALMEEKIAANPENRAMLMVAHRFFEQIGDVPRMLAVAERLLMLEPSDAQRARSLAVLYLNTERADKAVEVVEQALEAERVDEPVVLVSLLWRALLQAGQPEEADARVAAAIERFPDHAADLGYERAVLAERAGDKRRSEQLMQQVLERFPDHAPTNNGLGYTWTVQGKHLERAREMIQRAVDAEPDNAAYLDSLGWVYYKLGRFDEAVVWLRRARAAEGGAYPVILDHLGDALHRTDKPDEAQRVWQEALVMMRQQRLTPSEDPELEGLGERLTAKLKAAQGEGEPELAPVPGAQAGE